MATAADHHASPFPRWMRRVAVPVVLCAMVFFAVAFAHAITRHDFGFLSGPMVAFLFVEIAGAWALARAFRPR